MGDLTKNFSRSEFSCACNCGFDTVDHILVVALQELRDQFGPITINSSCRCEAHNKAVGGGKRSQHLLGKAADFTISVLDPLEVYRYLHPLWRGGLGKYSTFTHIDSRNEKARWG